MSEVFRVSDLIPMEKLRELMKDPEVVAKARKAGWNLLEIQDVLGAFEIGDESVAKPGDKPETPNQCALIALSEYQYWRQQERTDDAICGMAAAANIYAAITFGHFAPWHPGYPKEEKKDA